MLESLTSALSQLAHVMSCNHRLAFPAGASAGANSSKSEPPISSAMPSATAYVSCAQEHSAERVSNLSQAPHCKYMASISCPEGGRLTGPGAGTVPVRIATAFCRVSRSAGAIGVSANDSNSSILAAIWAAPQGEAASCKMPCTSAASSGAIAVVSCRQLAQGNQPNQPDNKAPTWHRLKAGPYLKQLSALEKGADPYFT